MDWTAPDEGTAPARILVAGVGNIFLGDDGFGPEVARRLAAEGDGALRDVRVVDYGIRGTHLVFDLLDGVSALVLVDAVPAGSDGTSAPGSIRVLQIRPEDVDGHASPAVGVPDAHGMDPVAALGGLRALGGELPLTFLVGCVPADITEGIGLSPAVADAVPEAMAVVRTLVRDNVPAGG